MKKILIFLFTILSAAAAFGQSHLVGVSGGVNVARMTGYGDAGFLVAPVAGVNYQLRFAEILSFETGLLYDQRGGIGSITYTDEMAQEIRDLRVPHRHKYLSVPVKFGMISRGEVYGFGNVGVMPSYLMVALLDYPESTISSEAKVDYSELVYRIDVAVLLEGGVGKKISDNLHVMGTAGVQMGLLDVIKEESVFGSQSPFVHHYGFSIAVSVRYAFGGAGSEN